MDVENCAILIHNLVDARIWNCHWINALCLVILYHNFHTVKNGAPLGHIY